ncbi:MAG: phosphatase PAP2 family protein [Candidatus Cloacimonetes bacterium]|nr:phosphatase PAP2 family protein [Candidatus Cloacimonadota bacterium]
MKKRNLLQAIDILVIIYCLLNIIYILAGILMHGLASDRMHDPLRHISIFSFIIVFVLVLSRIYNKFPNRFWRIVRDWYVMIFFLYFFEVNVAVNRIIFPNFIDEFFARIDLAIFGYQPAIQWGLTYDSWLISEILHFCYFSYYLMGLFFLFVYFKDRLKFKRYVFTLTFVFYVCYMTFNILPVIGGRNLPGMMELTETARHGLFTQIMAFIYRSSPHLGGAFPSSHVAVAVTVNLCAFDYKKLTGWLILPIVLLLIVSTVYGHYHYFIDTVFGLLYGIGFYLLGKKLYQNRETVVSYV